jgi:sarcosine oxidase
LGGRYGTGERWDNGTVEGTPDIGVVGAGIVGLSTAYALRERSASVCVYDGGLPGAGQSTGETRIFRHAHDDPRLVEFARVSRGVWDEWGERLGVELVSRDGAIALGPAVERRLALLERAGVPARAIGRSELAARLPVLAGYEGLAMLDEAGGAIRVRSAIAALSGELGDGLVTDEVISLRPTAWGTVEVRCRGRRTEHSRVVVCAGTGTARLARSIGLSPPVRLSAHARATFEVRDRSELLACLQDGSGEFGEPAAYGAPLPGNERYAVGIAENVAVREDGSFLDPEHLATLAERAGDYVRRALPGLAPDPVALVHCWITELPWGDDGMGVWESDGLLFAAGHNLFKQAPALGRALASAALGEDLPAQLRPEAELGVG